MDKIEVHRTGAETGFPIKITTTLQSQITQPDGSSRMLSSTWGSEVVELKEGPLELTLFDVPKDFQRVEALRNWSAQPPLSAHRLGMVQGKSAGVVAVSGAFCCNPLKILVVV